MDLQILAIALSNIAVIAWFRAESRNDWRQADARFNAHLEAMHLELKDFHGRLCSIEEKKHEKN